MSEKKWNPNQIVIGRHANGEPVVLVLPQSLAEAAARIAAENGVAESCKLSAQIQDRKLALGQITQDEYDAWRARWLFVYTNAVTRANALAAWADAVISAAENDALAVEQQNRLVLLELRVKELSERLSAIKSRQVQEGLVELSRRAQAEAEGTAPQEHGEVC